VKTKHPLDIRKAWKHSSYF